VAYREVNFRRILRVYTHEPEGANGVFNDLVELRCRLVSADYVEAATARDKETTRATTARENEQKTDGGLRKIRPDAVGVCEHSLEQSVDRLPSLTRDRRPTLIRLVRINYRIIIEFIT
jgi:hypothetical protein